MASKDAGNLIRDFQGNADDDDEAGTTQGKGSRDRTSHGEDDRKQGDESQSHGTHEGDAVEDAAHIALRLHAGLDSRDIRTRGLEVLRDPFGIDLQLGVEVGEEDDEDRIDDGTEGEAEFIRERRHRLIVEDVHDDLCPMGRRPGRVEEGDDDRGGDHDGGGKDDGHDGRGIDLDGEEGGLLAGELVVLARVGVADGELADALLDEGDEDDDGKEGKEVEDHLHRSLEDQRGIATGDLVAEEVGEGIHDLGGKGGDDAGEDEDGDTVSDTLVRDLVAKPVEHHGAGGHEDDDLRIAPRRRIVEGDALGIGDGDDDAIGLDRRKDDGQDAGDDVEALPSGLAFLRHLRERGKDVHGEELDDDGGRDVGGDAQSEEGEVLESSSAHHVQEREGIGGIAEDVVLDRDSGNSNSRSDSEHKEDGKREENAIENLFVMEKCGYLFHYSAPFSSSET